MTFEEILDQAVAMLQRRGRIAYSALKRQFDLNDAYLEDLKDALLFAHPVVDEDGRGLVWTGDKESERTLNPSTSDIKPDAAPTAEPEREPLSYTPPHLAEKILTSRSALEGERKQVTVLFCDLQDSTPLAEKIGPENMHALLNRFFELALSEVHRYEGTINQFLGDGFMALFGAPISHEDHARRAVLAALGLQRTLKESALGAPYGVECAFRIGINSGLVVVGSIGDNLRMDYSAIGDTTNLAARLQTQSEPGEILVSETTTRLVEGYIRLEALEPVEVKGKTEPVPIYKVIGTLPRRSPIVSRSERTLSQFVGRERELATLEELFAQVEAGQGQVVGIVAEAGQGKSRLLYEFRQRLQDKPVTYLEGRCLSYGSCIPYHPIIDVLRHNCGIGETDNPEAIIEKVGIALQEVGVDPEESAPYLLQLLGVREGTEAISLLTPEAVRNRIFDTLRQMSLNGAQRRPLIFEVEDLHWVDKTSEDYMMSLVESLPGASILLLTTYRPGYRPPWLEKSYATQISLHSLIQQDALTIVHSTTQDQTLPDHLAQTIIDKAEGNPFFLEELTRVIIEHGSLQDGVTVPDTVQGVLSARIDRLPEAHKRLLQTASVLGREFSSRLLEAIWDSSGSLDGLLSELKRLEFLFERTGVVEPVYVFKHALTQDVAYESLLTTRRQTLHAAAGQALEALYTHRLEDAYDRLAYHYARTDNAAKAVEYLTRVADRAMQGYAHAEAVVSLQTALVHAERLSDEDQDRCVLNVVLHYAQSLFYLGRLQESLDLLLRQQERLERLQEPFLIGRYAFRVSLTYSVLGHRERATQHAQQALEAGQQAEDTATRGMAHYVLALEGVWSGRFEQGAAHGQQAVILLERTPEEYWLSGAHWTVGMNWYLLGEFAQALHAYARLHAMSEATGDARHQHHILGVQHTYRKHRSYAAFSTGLVYAQKGDWEVGIQACQQGLEQAPDAWTTAMALGFLGYAYLEHGDTVEAVSQLEQAVEQFSQFRFRPLQGQCLAWVGTAYLMRGHIEKARDSAIQGLAIAKDDKHWYGVGLAQRTLGQIAYTSSNLIEAESCLHEALTTFENIQARYELARTHLVLASLAYTQGNRDTTTTHLSTAYAWFQKLQVPKWAERTAQLAQEYGVTLTEVELDKLTEGSS